MRFEKLKKATATILTLFMLLGPLTSCSDQEQLTTDTTVTQTDKQETTPSAENTLTLDDINPTFKNYQNYLQMDEESLYQIIKIAMRDVKNFYKSDDMQAPNMTYDKNLNIIEDDDKFYPDWMTAEHYLARSMAESTHCVNAKTKLPSQSESGDTHAVGIMQICENSIKETLMQYYRYTFGNYNVDIFDLEIVPSQNDIQNASTSKQAKKRIVLAVYNNFCLAISTDVYNAKNLNPITHSNYYPNGFDENTRRLAVIAMYGSNRADVINALKAGNILKVFENKKDLGTYLVNINNYEELYKNKYSEKNNAEAQEYQP